MHTQIMAVAKEPHPVLSLLAAPLMVGLVLAVLFTKPWWWPDKANEALPATDVPVLGFVGGCGAFKLYAQYRWEPYGASERAAPNSLAKKVESYGPNEIVAVDGWVHADIPYPDNPPPFNNGIWFHLSDGSGWVSFAAVRALPTSPDPTSLDEDGGPPATALPQCEGAVR